MLSRFYRKISAIWDSIKRSCAEIGRDIGSFTDNVSKKLSRKISIRKKEFRVSDTEELDEAIEFAGFSYEPQQDIFYSDMYVWQRDFGYCRLYDEAASFFGMIVDSEPIYFEYGGKNWLIELWKGQYDLTTGGEIGVYTAEECDLNIPGVFNAVFYDSARDEDRLQMAYILKKNGKTLFTREGTHWWLTGFKLGEFSSPSELTMEISITLKDETMCNAFVEALNNAGYSDDKTTVFGDTVYLRFDKPCTPQPITRTKATDWIIQMKNKYLCDKFQEITGTNNNMQDKLKMVREKAPGLYRRILNIGKTQNLYKRCKTINNYFK